MDNAKFTYYDIVGFIIPGAVAFMILYWFITAFLVFPLTIGKDVPDSVAILITLVGGYFLGHVVHAIGKSILGDDENLLSRLWCNSLKESSQEYREQLVTDLERTFGPELAKQTRDSCFPDAPTDKDFDKHFIELFHLTHALTRKANMAINTDMLEAASNMYRGLYACAVVSAITCFAISLKQLLLLLTQQLMPSDLLNVPFFTLKLSQLTLGMFLTLLFTISAQTLFLPRWNAYKGYYVKSVLTNLHIWCQLPSDERKA